MKNTCLFYIVFQVLKRVLLIESQKYSYQLLLIVVLHYLLHQQISFFTTFQNLIQNCLKKDFCHEFAFFSGFTQIWPAPSRPKSAKRDESFLSMLPCRRAAYLRALLIIYDVMELCCENRLFLLAAHYIGKCQITSAIARKFCYCILRTRNLVIS